MSVYAVTIKVKRTRFLSMYRAGNVGVAYIAAKEFHNKLWREEVKVKKVNRARIIWYAFLVKIGYYKSVN